MRHQRKAGPPPRPIPGSWAWLRRHYLSVISFSMYPTAGRIDR